MGRTPRGPPSARHDDLEAGGHVPPPDVWGDGRVEVGFEGNGRVVETEGSQRNRQNL